MLAQTQPPKSKGLVLLPAGWDRVSLETLLVGLMLILASTVPNLDLVMSKEDGSFKLDPQLFARLAICGTCGLLALWRLDVVARAYVRFPAAWLVLIGVCSALTIPVSVSPVYCAAAVFANACVIAFVPVAVHVLRPTMTVRILLISSLVYLTVNWLLYFFVPELGRGLFVLDGGVDTYRLGGDPQNLGLQAGWTIMLALYLWLRGESLLVVAPIVLFSCATCAFTQSRTGMVLCILVTGMYVLHTQGIGAVLTSMQFLVIGLLAVALGLLPINSEAIMNKLSRSGKSEEIYNLTGRTFIWDYVTQKIMERPILGHGYGCARHALEDFEDSGYRKGELHHGHNVFLNMALTTGLPGAALLGVTLLVLAWRAWSNPDYLADCITLGILVSGFAEPMIFGPMPRSHTVLFALAVSWRELLQVTPFPVAKQALGGRQLPHLAAPYGEAWQ